LPVFLPPDLLEKVGPEIADLGEHVLSQQILDWVTDAEKNLPHLRGSGRDAFGKPRSELIVTEGWRKLQEFGFKKGYVMKPPRSNTQLTSIQGRRHQL
jgi:hypothetical protein